MDYIYIYISLSLSNYIFSKLSFTSTDYGYVVQRFATQIMLWATLVVTRI